MTTRAFNPRTVTLNAAIRVERTEQATILAVPRYLEDFAHARRPSLRERLFSRRGPYRAAQAG
ncbi:hypothetical protein [Corynebacterium nasicanis]|uniref:Uncharacterized protein n=1 Tax=Corynebacterium nasicanis TaxID=1448267 RepID=A0ABW1QED9_9CORY